MQGKRGQGVEEKVMRQSANMSDLWSRSSHGGGALWHTPFESHGIVAYQKIDGPGLACLETPIFVLHQLPPMKPMYCPLSRHKG